MKGRSSDKGSAFARMCVISLLASISCRTDGAPHLPARPQLTRFEDMFAEVARTYLEVDTGAATRVNAGLVRTDNLFLLHGGTAEIRRYRRKDGRLEALVSGPGDAAGDVRSPVAIAGGANGRIFVYDSRRRVLSIRDSFGLAVKEIRPPVGNYAGLVALPDGNHILLSGDVASGGSDLTGADLHEFDSSGTYLRSFGKRLVPDSKWKRAFHAEVVAKVERYLVTGYMNGTRLRLVDGTGSHERWVIVSDGWPSLSWPSDRLLTETPGGKLVADRVRDWMHANRLLNGLHALPEGRILVRFQSFTTSGERMFYYTTVDTGGLTKESSYATTRQVISVSADTLFWIQPQRYGLLFGASVVGRQKDLRLVQGPAAR